MKRKIQSLFLFFVLSGFIGIVYWWKAVHPFIQVRQAVLTTPTVQTYATFSGRLSGKNWREGDLFKKGEPLCFFDDASFEIQKKEARAKEEACRQKLEQEKNKLEQVMQKYVHVQTELKSPELMDQVLVDVKETHQKITEFEAELATLEKEGSFAEKTAQEQTLFAPFEGMVFRSLKQPGEWVSLGEPIFSICKSEERWLEAEILENELSKIETGLPATITFSSFPQKTWIGKISWISPIVSDGRIKVRVAAEELPVKPGLHAEILIKVR